MEIIYLLIPISLLLLGLILWVLFWAVRDGQYDDMEGPAHRILMDEDNESYARKRKYRCIKILIKRIKSDPDYKSIYPDD